MKKILITIGLIVSCLAVYSQVGVYSSGGVDAYTKTQLQTSGRASIDWGNLKNVPDTVMSMIDSSVMLNVRDFGAVGDGVTDDRDAILNAINAAKSTGKTYVIFPDSVYKIESEIGTITTNKSLKLIAGKGKTIIDGSSITGDYAVMFRFANASSNLTTITDTIVIGQFYVKSALEVSPGEVIELRSDRHIANGLTTTYFGELCLVRDTVGDSISVWMPIRYNYSASGTQIRKFGDNTIEIEGIGVKGNISYKQYGIYISGYKNAIVNHCNTINCMYSGIMYDYVYGGLIANNSCVASYATGLGYPICFSSSEHIKIDNNLCIGGRHGISGGGTIWCNDITISNNTIKNQLTYGLNTHSNCDYVKILNNTIYGHGMSLHSKNLIISGNNVYATDNNQSFVNSTPIYLPEVTPGYFILKDNIYHNDSYTGTFLINYQTGENINFSEFYVLNNITDGSYGVYLTPLSTDTLKIDNMIFSGNIFNTSAASLYFGSPTTYLQIDYLNMTDNILQNNFMMQVDTLISANISNNTIKYTTYSTSNFLLYSHSKFTNLANNMFIGDATVGFHSIRVQSCENILIKGNTLFNAKQVKGVNVFDSCTKLDLIGNSFIGCTGVLSLNATSENNQDANY